MSALGRRGTQQNHGSKMATKDFIEGLRDPNEADGSSIKVLRC